MLMPEIARYMTREPYSVASTESVARAREVMTSHEIRHLPVIDGGELVGVVHAAELTAIEAIPGVDRAFIEVARIMVRPVCVWSSTTLDEVSSVMADQKADCVVVLGGHGVEGIFTAVDALRALKEVLSRVTE